MAHLVLATGKVLGRDEGLKDLETRHRNSSHHCRARVRLSLAEQTDNWRECNGERGEVEEELGRLFSKCSIHSHRHAH